MSRMYLGFEESDITHLQHLLHGLVSYAQQHVAIIKITFDLLQTHEPVLLRSKCISYFKIKTSLGYTNH